MEGERIMRKWYRITGITEEMYEAWKEDIRPDLIIWKVDDVVCVRAILNPIEALIIKVQMWFTNRKCKTNFQLKELKGSQA